MKNLFASWRIDYILRKKEKDCIFCKFPAENNDTKNLILKRGNFSFIMLNAYPYAPGHVMISPYSHKSMIEDLISDEIFEIFDFQKRTIKALKKIMTPDGFNIGINLGKAAGAGIESHLHWHVVPRWSGDYNFMPVIAKTRIISESLKDSFVKLKPKF